METKAKKERLIKVSESTILSLVAEKLKGTILFPEKVKSAKQYLSNIKSTDLSTSK